ncbi:Trk family potassium uptake protein [Clostridium sp. MCC353]|uniref:TrkH family potassium uptake protein n=1 Tax=Clostridium sp. MCC353 TaxID=2592646 RepID=UPI001C00E092|nr:TrkH family potassium uptake protein [Clostridium sp. MCC353]MBT9777582.1 Trk family potassium uptake protein [Clostridium sp. MCC353]
MKEPKIFRIKNHLTQTQFIAYGFLGIILTGTVLLKLPFASKSGISPDWITCLFTATSASCVTGLIVADTWTQWSLFGQIVIITMIQIGGLGFITIGVFVSIILRRKIGLKTRGLMQESISTLQIGGMVKLAKKIIIGTACFEGAGAILLASRFIPEYGFFRGAFYGIFHSISAFCNAGFDLMGHQAQYSSFVNYYDDWIVNLVIMLLIIIGGIGFIVWDDLSQHKLKFRKYKLHTKIVLITTFVLVFGSAFLFYLFERNNLLVGMNTSGKILTSLFSSVTARTAGFNTVDTAALSDGSKLLTIILMFIGGSPGSTAGGVKTTTIVVLILYVVSNIRRTYGVNVFGRRLEDDSIKRASSIFTINLLLAMTASLVIMMVQPLAMTDVLFETFSAIGTVGMTTGITRSLLPVSRIIIILLMYCGRIGSLSFALSFTQRKKIAHVQQPVERITVG